MPSNLPTSGASSKGSTTGQGLRIQIFGKGDLVLMSNGDNSSQYELFRGSVCHWYFVGTNKLASGVAQVD